MKTIDSTGTKIRASWVTLLVMLGMAFIPSTLIAALLIHSQSAETYKQDISAWHNRVTGCERGKKDRTVDAKAFRAQSDYLKLVLGAKSVKQDVKQAARKNLNVQNRSASSLESRTGKNLDCNKVNPKPPTPPLVKELP